jgi:hypothetical protein
MVLLGLSWWFLATEGRPPSELRQEPLANAVADASQFGPAQVMTADDGMEFQLSVDQQGQQFVYLQQRQGAKPQWWLQQADGSRSALTFAEPEVRQVVLSPDAQSVVYQGCQLQRGVQQCQLLWRPVTRLQADMLLSYPDDSALQLSWQPDGQAIFFRMRDHKSLPYQIYRYSLATKQLQPLTLPPAGQSDIALTIDPMGQQLVVLRYEQQQQRQLLWYRLPDLTLFNQQSVPVAATVVAFDHQQRLWLDCPDGIGSRLCRWQAKDAILTAELAVPGAVLSLMVAGEQLWFSAGQQRSQIWRQQLPFQIEPNPNAPASLATKATVEVSSTRLELMPRVFEQDLVFLSNRHGRHQIWRRQADGSSAVLAELPAPAGFVRLSRSDDGQYLAFSHHGALYLLHLQSAMCWPLLGSTEKVGVVNWHQHQLIFSSERSGDWQLWRYLDPLSKAVGAKHHGGKPGQCVAAEPETTLATTEADLQQLTQQGAYSGVVWRNQLLYSKYHQDGLFQLELDQPEPTEQLVLADFDRINWLNWQLIGDNLSYFQPGQGVLTRPLQLTTADKVQVGAATLVFPQQSGFIHQYQRTEQAIWWVQSTEQQADVLRLSLKD